MSQTEIDEIIADSMVTLADGVAAHDATVRMLKATDQTRGARLNDWADILAWTPQTDSARFVSANGL